MDHDGASMMTSADDRGSIPAGAGKYKYISMQKTLIIQFLSLHSQYQRPKSHGELSNSQALRELKVGFYFLLGPS